MIAVAIAIACGTLSAPALAGTPVTWNGSNATWATSTSWNPTTTLSTSSTYALTFGGTANRVTNNNVGTITLDALSFINSGSFAASGTQAFTINGSTLSFVDAQITTAAATGAAGGGQAGDILNTAVQLSGSSTISLGLNHSLSLNGVVSGAGSLTVTGGGTTQAQGSLYIWNANDYSGNTTINGGFVVTGSQGSTTGSSSFTNSPFGNGSGTVSISNGTVLVRNNSLILNPVTISGSGANGNSMTGSFGTGSQTAEVRGNITLTNSTRFNTASSSGGDTTSKLLLSGTVNLNANQLTLRSGFPANGGPTAGLLIEGAGDISRVLLSGSNTYSGGTTITRGLLQIGSAGSINTSSGVTVNGSGAGLKYNSASSLTAPLTLTQGTLSGTGAIGTAVTVGAGAIIAPGNSPGVQSYLSSVWSPGGTYQWELNALSGTAGTNWDLAAVMNALDLSGLSTGSKFNLDLITLTGSNTAGPLDSAYVYGPTYVFPFVSYGSLLSGTFSNAAGTDLTSLFNISVANWQGSPKPAASDISVKVNSTGTGLDLVIVPEPGTLALAALGIVAAGIWRSRRWRRS